MNYQAFFKDELGQAADSLDHQGELNLFFLHYHQAIFEATLELHLCQRCSKLDLSRLKLNARDLQQSEFATIKELMNTVNHRLRDADLLCSVCQSVYEHDVLVRFFLIRTKRQNNEKED